MVDVNASALQHGITHGCVSEATTTVGFKIKHFGPDAPLPVEKVLDAGR